MKTTERESRESEMADEPGTHETRRMDERGSGEPPRGRPPERGAANDSSSRERALARAPKNTSLMGYDLNGKFRLPKRYRDHKSFFRQLLRVASDSRMQEALVQLRDAVIRSKLKEGTQGTGLTVAMADVQGDEGSDIISLLLSLALGSNTHFRIAYLDGTFDSERFEAVTQFLSLTKRTRSVDGGPSRLLTYYNPQKPNVFFLRNALGEKSLEFFSHKQLHSFLDTLKQHFDFTVIGMPPLAKESSNVFLAPVADRLYLVTAAGKTRLAELDRCIQVAEDSNAQISGVVVNRQRLPIWARLLWREYFA